MDVVMSSIHMWLTFAVIIGAIFLYASEWFSVEIISLGALVTLLLIFYLVPLEGNETLTPMDLLAGFAHPAVITILALMVIGQGMSQTAAFEGPTTLLLRYGRHRPRTLVLLCLLLVMALSAFLNDTPVVVMFLPVMIVLANKLGETPGRVLMPLSFAAILGGMTTLLGTSTNLLVAGSYLFLTGEEIGFFDFTVPGLVMALVGFCYLSLAAPYLLRSHATASEDNRGHHGRQFIVQLHLRSSSPYVGRTAVAGMLPGLEAMTVRLIERRGEVFLPPFEDVSLKAGDVVTGALTRDQLHDILSEDTGMLRGGQVAWEPHQNGTSTDVPHLYEVLVAPASTLEGRTLQEVGATLAGGSRIIGVQRKTRMPRSSLYGIRLEAGDILLVCGNAGQMRALRNNRDVVLMEWSGHALLDKGKKWAARLIFLGTVFASASGLLPIVIAAVGGAFLMVTSGCLTVHQASRAVSRRVYMLVAAALGMGAALEASGGAAFLALGLVETFQGASAPVMLSAMFVLIAVISNILSNNTTAILFTPIAVDMANQLELPTLPFVVTVIFAANCSFATPVSYQTNLLVMGPGRYVFGDYLRFGVPLVILLWLTFTLFVPWYYGL